jgi:hypothetical protein
LIVATSIDNLDECYWIITALNPSCPQTLK